eukprot:m.181602 g.181602  ORF g.181602 m.181602 type:complete len:110 (+) comp16630_c1_seq1:135-464(+)
MHNMALAPYVSSSLPLIFVVCVFACCCFLLFRKMSDIETGLCIVSVDPRSASTDDEHQAKKFKEADAAFPAWYDAESKKLKLAYHFSKGLELAPRAAARVYLHTLPMPV